MKTIITMILMISVSLSYEGVVYMDLGLAPEGEVEMDGVSLTNEIETGSVSLGWYHPVYQVSDNIGLFAGGSYELVPAKDDDVEFGFAVLYASLGYAISDQLSAWGSFGMSIPTSDDLKDADAENGMHMGMGVTYSATEKIGVALGYIVNSTSTGDGDMSADWNFSKMTLSLGYRL